jgi:hypothetical protein
VFAVTSPFYLFLIILIMQTRNGNENQPALEIPEVSLFTLFTPQNMKLLEELHDYGINSISNSLKEVHDLLLYHSTLPIDKEEKAILFDLKILSDAIEKIK